MAWELFIDFDIVVDQNFARDPHNLQPFNWNNSKISEEKAQDKCESNPCKNSGECIPITNNTGTNKNRFLCKCKNQFIGALCELTDYCQNASSNCLNGGSCINLHDGYKCMCDKEWTGQSCETFHLTCSDSTCLNGGICMSLTNSNRIECKCPVNYNGKYCEIFDICSLRPCKNNGKCTFHAPSRLECDCPAGFLGMFCELVEPCLSTPCLNNGSCHGLPGQDYSCTCATGFAGKRCDQCKANFNGPKCDKCLAGYFGEKCDQVVNACEISGPCQHGFCKYEPDKGSKCYCFEGKFERKNFVNWKFVNQ